MVDFHGEMVLLENHSDINYTSLAKILKKYDKRIGELLRLPFIQKVLQQAFFSTDLVSKLVKNVKAPYMQCSQLMAAMSITHQMGAISGTPVVSESGNGTAESTAALSAAAVWKLPLPAIRCRAGAEIEGLSPPVSPCLSPVMGGMRADLSVACQAFATEIEAAPAEREYRVGGTKAKGKGVPVYVMMPLDSVTMGNGVNRRKAMKASMQALKSAGVEGVMMDVWWGLVERDSPGTYNWGGYAELLEMAKQHGLKVQAVMSFHQCGGNVGDSCTIPLPNWVVEEINKDPDLAYTDQWGRRNYEYVSLGSDTLPVLKGRTPVQCYADFMRAFKDNFKHLLGDTIVEIQVGMGPAGEFRYPSYPEQDGTWKFPGIGAFQCYDKYMLSSLKAAAEAAGKPEWGSTGPTDAGHYNNWPEDARFFRREGGGWTSPYGEFFLNWYSQMLLDHGERILSSAKSIFQDMGVKISVKMKEGKDSHKCRELVEREAEHSVHVTRPLVQEAAQSSDKTCPIHSDSGRPPMPPIKPRKFSPVHKGVFPTSGPASRVPRTDSRTSDGYGSRGREKGDERGSRGR
ncbi:unnamed protein product, partial [Vitis vinifera]